MSLPGILVSAFLLLQNPDFGAKFLDDLQTLFGRLETSELDSAFQRAKAIRCSDLIGKSGEWRDVGFLNDNRNLAAWHYEDIDSVKSDPVRYVFSGMCSTEQSALKLATRYPIKESYDQVRKGTIPISKVAVRDNPPVSVFFDKSTNSYTFQLPFLYAEGASRAETTYTLMPPTAASKPEAGLADEFRCKAVSDADLTYRFLLCRTALVNLNAPTNSKQRIPDSPNSWAYYIFSDGREASSSVNLLFENAPQVPKTATPEPDLSPAVRNADEIWNAVPPQSGLVDVGNGEFRLRFDPATWAERIGKPQLIEGRTVSALTAGSTPLRKQGNCVWQPASATQASRLLASVPSLETLYTLAFQKQASSGISVSFDIEGSSGRIGRVECYFPQSQTPADVTVGQWSSIVGSTIVIEARQSTSIR
jgi:hypothetical protein